MEIQISEQGAYLHANRWYFGLSTPRILTSKFSGSEDYEALEKVGYYVTGGIVVDVNKNRKV